MKKIEIFNANLPQQFVTDSYTFKPVKDFQAKYKQWEKANKVARHINSLLVYALPNKSNIPNSYFYPKQPKIWDYCSLLSFFQLRNVFPGFVISEDIKTKNLFFRLGKSYNWPLLTTDEVRLSLNKIIKKVDGMNNKKREVFLKTLKLFFEAELFTKYADLKDVWYLLSMEYFCRSLYCLDRNITNWRRVRVTLIDFFRYCVNKYNYESYIKQFTPTADLTQFLQDIVDVRNWVMHGKVWNLNVYHNYGGEFSFYHRVSGLIKMFLLSFLEISKFKNHDALLHGIVYGYNVVPLWATK